MRSSGRFSSTLELWPADAERRCALLAAALAGGWGVIRADLPVLARGVLLTGLVAALLAAIAGWLRPDPGAVRRVLLTAGGWRIFLQGSALPRQAELVFSWGVSFGPVIALGWRLRDSGRPAALWVTRRTVAPDTWRRLRVHLHLS